MIYIDVYFVFFCNFPAYAIRQVSAIYRTEGASRIIANTLSFTKNTQSYKLVFSSSK